MTAAIQTRTIRASGGVSLAADVGGEASAPAVVLLHGGGQTRHSWAGAMRELVRRGYCVVSYDARGHGDSDWAADGDYSLQAMAADLAAVVATLPSAPALIGASMGGGSILQAAGDRDPDWAAALILVDLVPRVDPAGVAKIIAFMASHAGGFASLAAAADAVAAYNPHRARSRSSVGLMKNLRRRADGRLYWHWDPKLMSSHQRIEPPQFTGALLAAAERIRVPTLLVRGLQSEVVSDAGVEEFRRLLPALEVFDVAGAGHMVVGDRNDVFNRGIITFLDRHHPV